MTLNRLYTSLSLKLYETTTITNRSMWSAMNIQYIISHMKNGRRVGIVACIFPFYKTGFSSVKRSVEKTQLQIVLLTTDRRLIVLKPWLSDWCLYCLYLVVVLLILIRSRTSTFCVSSPSPPS